MFFVFQKLPISVTVQAENYIRVDVFHSLLEYGAPTRGLYTSELQHCISAGRVPGWAMGIEALIFKRSGGDTEGRMSWACFLNKRILIAEGGVDASGGFDNPGCVMVLAASSG